MVFKNNKLINNADYGGGNYESYICTPEQYQVIAEFTDYIQKTKSKYKIVPMDDESIEWKYVDDAVYDFFLFSENGFFYFFGLVEVDF